MNMNGSLLRTNAITSTFSSPSPILPFHFPKLPSFLYDSNVKSFRPFALWRTLSLSALRVFDSVLPRQSPNFMVCWAMDLADSMRVLDDEGDDLIVEACLTRILPPALTLHHGLVAIKQAAEELMINPPSIVSGLIRFEVDVPPTAKALNWFCCQPQSSGVFPQFYASKQPEDPCYLSTLSNKTRGIFGMGSAVNFKCSASTDEKWGSLERYLLVDSPNITAYGFTGVSCTTESAFVTLETGSLFFFIPQVELREYEGFSTLAGTIVWNNSFDSTFNKALNSFLTSLLQASCYIPSSAERWNADLVRANLRKYNVIVDEELQMVYMNASLLGTCNVATASTPMKDASLSHQFCIRFSSTSASTASMVYHTSEKSCILQDSANINFVWASLIVEECVRLGLTYFCIAPGSRSSPLAVAASSHPHTNCIACFDERSLAFHAIGYARGSERPAVVITTSGTAVSNLLPAVVEASQDFVPLLLLTADRPSELHEAGANQAINQVNHFGSYVRFFFNLPAPTDHITARMVLTTIDSAVYRSTSPPYGPVHINCPFREPLDSSPQSWTIRCLDGLNHWISSFEPLTKYVHMQTTLSCAGGVGSMADVKNLIQGADCGLLVLGAIHREDEIYAALIVARHLSWPVYADILSGLRLRKLLASLPEYEENLTFIDNFDHVLLCDAVRQWAKVDVIIQIGSKITSKRISQMLERCCPCSYIMVDSHPCRHDPSHIVTHRIQSSISQFADFLLNVSIPCMSSNWTGFLQGLNKMVAWELSFLIKVERLLSEPHVAHVISEVLSSESALFIGNSMAIRDADMYCQGLINCSLKSPSALPCHWIKVAGNRGASGIDGLLSTATGFAVGSKKRVLCVIGDVSFLHDTNGLATLSSRVLRKPVTIVVINNHGGAIFSFLPIAERAEARVLNEFFYYGHDISINKLCAAHGVKHMLATTKLELQEALLMSQQADTDCVVEVESSIESNATLHSVLRRHASRVAGCAFTVLSGLSIPHSVLEDFFLCKISRLEYSLYKIKLSAPPTSVAVDGSPYNLQRQGFILTITLDDGSVGFGEVAPLDIHKESLVDVEEQLRFIIHVLKGATLTCLLPLLRGSFSSWIWRTLGVTPFYIFPSVRCGLEMAILNAIAAKEGTNLLGVLSPRYDKEGSTYEWPSSIQICALVDSLGTPIEVADIAHSLVQEGFRAIKLKVGRRPDPAEDAAVVQEIRKKIGSNIEIRVDANRKWSYEGATKFASCVKDCGLQYIEEPVQDADNILQFYEKTGLPVALDETIDEIQENIVDMLARFTHPGIVALVIKPSRVGGFENAAVIAHWAHLQGKMAIISAAFESSLSLSSYVLFSRYLELENAEICTAMHQTFPHIVAHGLGTYKWLQEDVTLAPLFIRPDPDNGHLGASVDDAATLLRNFLINHSAILRKTSEEQVHAYLLTLECEHVSCSMQVQEIGQSSGNNVLLFLHGFLGTGEDWLSIMKSLSGSARCISVDLPGHGRSKVQCHGNGDAAPGYNLSVELVVALLCELIDKIGPGKVTLVGYSMGARLALYMALRSHSKVEGAIIVSGSPGLKNATARKIRAAKDHSRAQSLVCFGLRSFLETWYSADLWQSFRGHPNFKNFVERRLQHNDVDGLAKALSDLSVGKQQSLWEDLKDCRTQLLFIVGEKDSKFKDIARDISSEINDSADHEVVEVPECGHAVHLENPLAVVRLVRQFLTKKRKSPA